MEAQSVNFGGFIPLSTVDWRGRAVCTVFLRGCPVRCSYCHNSAILSGEDWRDCSEILGWIRNASILVSGVVFSGGEPTLQRDALLTLARGTREMGLGVAIQTNGVFPETIHAMLKEKLLDRVALDIKARWERYPNLLRYPCVDEVRRSLSLCRDAHRNGILTEFEVVITLFRGFEDEVAYIAREAGDTDLVLQQGVIRGVSPLSQEELCRIGSRLGRPVRVRSREGGEVICEGTRSGGIAGKRERNIL